MKLYSRRHIVFAVVASSVAAATLSAFVSRKIFSDGKAASKKESQSAIGLTVTDTEQASAESSSTIETTGKNGDAGSRLGRHYSRCGGYLRYDSYDEAHQA